MTYKSWVIIRVTAAGNDQSRHGQKLGNIVAISHCYLRFVSFVCSLPYDRAMLTTI